MMQTDRPAYRLINRVRETRSEGKVWYTLTSRQKHRERETTDEVKIERREDRSLSEN